MDSNSQSESPLGSVWVHSLPLSYIAKNIKSDFKASLLAYIFASLCLCHKPKASVATQFFWKYVYFCSINYEIIGKGLGITSKMLNMLFICTLKKIQIFTQKYQIIIKCYNMIRKINKFTKLLLINLLLTIHYVWYAKAHSTQERHEPRKMNSYSIKL